MLTALIALSMLAASDDPDGVVTTAPSGVQSVAADAVAPVVTAPAVTVQSITAQAITPRDLSTAEQIERWVGRGARAERGVGDTPRDPFAFRDDRKVHGEISAGIGTGDYSAFAARVSIPVGESGRIDLSYSQSKNSPWRYGYGYDGYAGRFGRLYADGYGLDEARVSPFRVRREWQEPIGAAD